MKRSEINRAIQGAQEFFASQNFKLPTYAFWSPETWNNQLKGTEEIRTVRLGWDVTDFGYNHFSKTGRTIFNLRNGIAGNSIYNKPYAQKIMMLQENQRSPIHYHAKKMEDIINHAGGVIHVHLWNTTLGKELSQEPMDISLDGVQVRVTAGEAIRLEPGQSLCIKPFTFHQFYALEGAGPVLSIEISSVCDDYGDNFGLEPMIRFPKIEEDEPKEFLLCTEYDA